MGEVDRRADGRHAGEGAPEGASAWDPHQVEEERLGLAVDAAELGLWDWDIRAGSVHWNEHHERIFGYEPGNPNRHYRDFADRVHPDELEIVESALLGSLRERRDYRLEHRIVRSDGSIRWIETFGRYYFGANGEAVRMVGVCRDVTDRKQAAQEIAELNRDLQRRVAEFRALLDVIPMGIAVAESPDCRRVWSNSALTRLLGLPPEANISLSAPIEENPGYRVFLEGREAQPGELPLQRAIATGREVRSVKQELRLTDGSSIAMLGHAVPLFDESGRIRGGLYAGVDITEPERIEQALREANLRLRAVFNQQFQYMAILSPDGTMLDANENCFRATGHRREDAIGRKLWDGPWWTRLSDMQERWRDFIARALASEGPVTGEIVYRVADGTIRHGSIVVTGLRDDTGQVTSLVVEGRDDTDRLSVEAALLASEERWRTMAEALPNLLWTDLPDGQCDWLSSQLGKYTGIPEQKLLGLRWLEEVIHPDDRDHVAACWRAACDDQDDYDLEYRIRRHDGEYRWFKTRGVPIRDDRGKIVYWFGTCTDIEDQKRAEAALQEADRRKDEFLATLAHELRNPLAPIRNSLQILRMPGVDQSMTDQSLGMMERQLHHLVRLVDDLLDVSRVMRGKINLHVERIDLARVVAHGVETAQPLIASKSQQLSILLPDVPIVFDVDPVRLAQVVGNLLTNAAKYTEPGGRIELSASREVNQVVLRIRDNGIGIQPDMLRQVFRLFVQADHALTRSQGGLGIGLTLVKNLVELHGGSVEARSDGPGRGSEFVVRLPLGTMTRPSVSVEGPIP